MSNAELFATVAREYANFRPEYPPELFAWLARQCVARELAWDCGCGSGQASVALAEHFDQVHATDVAPEQIAAAKPHPRVKYSVAPAEHSGLPDASVDLVTVAQALHWFDVRAFYAEAAPRGAARRAAGGLELSAAAVRGSRSSTGVFLDFYATWSGRIGRRNAGTSSRVTQTLPFPFEAAHSRKCHAGIRGRARLGPSNRCSAT